MSARAMAGEATTLSTWALLGARVPDEAIEWRQDGKPTTREGKHFARFVPYIDAPFVQERLDAHAPGEWELTHEVMPEQAGDTKVSLKARLTVFGVTRDGVGSGSDYKAAASDSFKRAAVRFGIGIELYSYPAVWVQVDSDGKYAKALESPQAVYIRMQAKLSLRQAAARAARGAVTVPDDTPSLTGGIAFPPPANAVRSCPKCGGPMWDNRESKRHPSMPDFRCKNDGKFGRPVCDGVIGPERTESERQRSLLTKPIAPPSDTDYPQALRDEEDDLPF